MGRWNVRCVEVYIIMYSKRVIIGKKCSLYQAQALYRRWKQAVLAFCHRLAGHKRLGSVFWSVLGGVIYMKQVRNFFNCTRKEGPTAVHTHFFCDMTSTDEVQWTNVQYPSQLAREISLEGQALMISPPSYRWPVVPS